MLESQGLVLTPSSALYSLRDLRQRDHGRSELGLWRWTPGSKCQSLLPSCDVSLHTLLNPSVPRFSNLGMLCGLNELIHVKHLYHMHS